MRRPIHVGLVFDYNLSYPRGVLRGIKQFAQTRPHWVLMHLDTDRMTAGELQTMRPAGMIALVVYDHLAKALRATRRPVVNVANVLPDLPFPRVSTDHRQVGCLAAEHLLDRGFRHFGFVGHPHHVYSLEREAGFRDTLASARFSFSPFHERPARSYRHRGRLLALNASLQRWLREIPRPVGIFACNDLWGLPVLEACRLTSLRVPDDVAVVGVDNDELRCELASPSLSSIVVPSERVGYEAAALLERLLKGTAVPRHPLLIPPVRVVTRQSSDVLGGHDPDVTAALRFIRQRVHLPLSVEEVVRETGLSRRALERRFRSMLERSIGDEIRRGHLERVRDLLATTALAMDEVAQQAGFASVHYMCRAFRKDMRLTPTAYRRQVRNPRGL
jgi:LacI family transcriptional regulator